MPPPSPNSQLDGISEVRQGMNCGVQPRLVASNQLAFGINITNRGGFPRTRPTFRKVPLTYESATTQTNATAAWFQDGTVYQSFGSGENCLVAFIGGRLFRYLVGSTNSVQDISIAADLNNPTLQDGWLFQGEDFLLANDGESRPLIFDGAATRRATTDELPPGCMGAYVQGRIWMVLPDRTSFMAGDSVNSHGFADGYNGRSAILNTTELSLFSGGETFSVPVNAGKITAMGVVGIPDTTLGQGPLQIFTLNSVTTVQVPFLRDNWFNGEYSPQTVGLPGYGSTGAWAVSPVNGDLWYRSPDGIRSYQIGRRDMGTWVHTPLSVEVEGILNFDARNLLHRSGTILFDNRLLVTCQPRFVAGRGVVHWGLVALDFNNISTITSRSEPCYDGLWTGLRILKMVKGTFGGVERCFAWALDASDAICLYELTGDCGPDYYFDWDGTADVPVQSAIVSRSMGWKDGGNVLKQLQCGDLYLDKLAGNDQIAFTFHYRSDEDPVWRDWHSFSLCAPIKDCTLDCSTFLPTRTSYRTYLRLPDPSDTPCSTITHRSPRTGYEFQVKMEVTGYFQLNRLHLWAIPKSDSVVRGCPTSETCSLVQACDDNWFGYQIET